MKSFVVHNSAIRMFRAKTFTELEKRLLRFGKRLRDYIYELISVPMATQGRSRPGESPHMETGDLRESLFVKPNNGGVDVGSTSPYALGLELGTAKVAARPFLLPSLFRMLSVLESSTD